MKKKPTKSFPFGKTKAANRMELLGEMFPMDRRKVSSLLSRYTDQLYKVINTNIDASTTKLLLHLLCQYNLSRAEVMKVHEDIRSYTKNLIKCRYRVFLSAYNNIHKFAEDQGKLQKRNQKRNKPLMGNRKKL